MIYVKSYLYPEISIEIIFRFLPVTWPDPIQSSQQLFNSSKLPTLDDPLSSLRSSYNSKFSQNYVGIKNNSGDGELTCFSFVGWWFTLEQLQGSVPSATLAKAWSSVQYVTWSCSETRPKKGQKLLDWIAKQCHSDFCVKNWSHGLGRFK